MVKLRRAPALCENFRSYEIAFAMPKATPAARLPTSAVCQALLNFETPVKCPFTKPKTASASKRDRDGNVERALRIAREHVGQQGNQAADDIRARDGERTAQRAPRVGCFEPQLEAHHEIAPGLRLAAKRGDDGRGLARE